MRHLAEHLGEGPSAGQQGPPQIGEHITAPAYRQDYPPHSGAKVQHHAQKMCFQCYYPPGSKTFSYNTKKGKEGAYRTETDAHEAGMVWLWEQYDQSHAKYDPSHDVD